MIIYQKINDKIRTTCVILSFSGSDISHGSSIHESHQDAVSKLPKGKVYVTGDTSAGATYSGYYADESKFSHYLKDNT